MSQSDSWDMIMIKRARATDKRARRQVCCYRKERVCRLASPAAGRVPLVEYWNNST